jgi:hypothetical protein
MNFSYIYLKSFQNQIKIENNILRIQKNELKFIKLIRFNL